MPEYLKPCGKPFEKGHTMGKGKTGRGKGVVVRTDAEVAASIKDGLRRLQAWRQGRQQ